MSDNNDWDVMNDLLGDDSSSEDVSASDDLVLPDLDLDDESLSSGTFLDEEDNFDDVFSDDKDDVVTDVKFSDGDSDRSYRPAPVNPDVSFDGVDPQIKDYDSELQGDSLGGDSLEDILSAADLEAYNIPEKTEDSFVTGMDFGDEHSDLAGLNIDGIIDKAINMGASDIYILPFEYITFKILGEVQRIKEFGEIPGTITRRLFQFVTSHVSQDDFANNLELDAAYVVRSGPSKGRRLRLSAGLTGGATFMTFRVIADRIPSPRQLEIADNLLSWCKLPNGLVLMNGPTGTGKSTTLASLLNEIRKERAGTILTIEKPVEYLFGSDGKAIVIQRNVGPDTRSFSSALDSAMRENPNIIMIGETRNKEELNAALTAAETGHLTISTMHTLSAPATLNRIKSMYTGDEQLRVLSTLSTTLKGIANQLLLHSIDGKSRFAVREVLNVDDEIARLVLHGDVLGITDYQMKRGITMEHELVHAAVSGKCTIEEARNATSSPYRFDKILKEIS